MGLVFLRTSLEVLHWSVFLSESRKLDSKNEKNDIRLDYLVKPTFINELAWIFKICLRRKVFPARGSPSIQC